MDTKTPWDVLAQVDGTLCSYTVALVHDLIDESLVKEIDQKGLPTIRKNIQAEKNRKPGDRQPRSNPLGIYGSNYKQGMTHWLHQNLASGLYAALLEGQCDVLATQELFDLASTIESYPMGCQTKWTPWEAIQIQAANALTAARSGLGDASWGLLDSAWATFTTNTRDATLDRGIMEARDLLTVQRRLLLSAGRTDLLPQPDGCLATPTYTDVLVPPPDDIITYVVRIRQYFQEQPKNFRNSKNKIIRAVQGKTESLSKALDWLEAHGEYKPSKKSD